MFSLSYFIISFPFCYEFYNEVWFKAEYLVIYGFWKVGADDRAVLDQIIDSLTAIANPTENSGVLNQETNKISMKVGKVQESGIKKGREIETKTTVLILGAGRVCQPAAKLLATNGSFTSHQPYEACLENDFIEHNGVEVIVGSLYLKDAEEVSLTEDIFSLCSL